MGPTPSSFFCNMHYYCIKVKYTAVHCSAEYFIFLVLVLLSAHLRSLTDFPNSEFFWWFKDVHLIKELCLFSYWEWKAFNIPPTAHWVCAKSRFWSAWLLKMFLLYVFLSVLGKINKKNLHILTFNCCILSIFITSHKTQSKIFLFFIFFFFFHLSSSHLIILYSVV